MFANNRGDGTERAKNLCAGCEHRDVCLAFAVDNQIDHGVWGGVGPRTRRQMRSDTPTAPRRRKAQCGTYSGYKAHLRLGTMPCVPCREAMASRAREWRAERRKGWVA
jgi:WhiB family redox-sensing transcriptional regulator